MVEIEYFGTNFNYKIYNSLGQLMATDKNVKDKTLVSLNEFNKGIYFIEVEIEDNLIRKKLILN